METVARRRTSPAELLRQIVHEWAITIGAKRQRILDAYFDSVIDSAERDKRIAELDRERTALNAIASREKPRATLSLEMLVDTFAPFVEFDLLNREDKRALLNTITPSITVSDYHVQGMYIGLEVNHTESFHGMK